MSNTQDSAPGATIPLALRVGGAFMALASVLFLFAVLSVFQDGWGALFEWTYSKLALCLAALILGGFATVSKNQSASKVQDIALVISVLLVIFSQFLSREALMIQEQYWVVMYAGAAVLCSLILRRTLM
ncbi:MAG: hypothetical protein SPJ78_06485 [Corynebacterium camporealensis]|uniref:hypothetical protein n=1 Tax=Corynebacterium camporealensis TaxID=161896 RepID=UPI002A91C8A1|nr:hypothetical protein [Corynebacterium camporealensis]MDY5840345.1 hypothetical protein [Corynebacterium camporealensis]